MAFIRFSIVTTFLTLFSGLCGALAAPVHLQSDGNTTSVDPHWVIYSDKWTGSSAPPDPATIKGYNVLSGCK